MATDRARISYDPTRHYRSVIAQQGRVTLEADVNEASSIASETLRRETIEVVGPAGTPDDGYKVGTDAKTGQLQVGSGTMYLGGWRLELDSAVDLDHQPDWLDQPPREFGGNLAVALLASEQAVGAVEDQALREVALGGPDTAGRARLMQHFLRVPLKGDTCAEGDAAVKALLDADGVTLDPHSLQLMSAAALQVSFVPPASSAGPCDPVAAGGYLGADNQLVRVTVVDYDPGTGTGFLLWGWNNASTLYRASITSANTLTLTGVPVDEEHAPQLGQAVEILAAQADLGNGDFIADPQGVVTTLSQGYSFDTGRIVLTDPLPTVPAGPNPPPVFVRLWQAIVPFIAGQDTPLDPASGLQVNLTLPVLPANIALRPLWRFAVRPSTPIQVYPRRYLDAPQPPDGPRQWITTLGIAAASPAGPGGRVFHSCRVPFKPLTKLDTCACCELTLDPHDDWLGKLNLALNSKERALSLCFQPGRFEVTGAIRFTAKSVRITGAGAGTVISGPPLEAVLMFDGCPSVTLSDFSVVAGAAGFTPSSATKGLSGAITVFACAQVDIERVTLTCADADLRSASCLAVSNPVPVPGAAANQFNVRVANSQFHVGHSQVGILMVNADRAQVSGNLITTPARSLQLTLADLAKRPLIAARLSRQLLHALTVTSLAQPSTPKARRRLLRKQRKQAARARTRAGAPAVPLPMPSASETATPTSEAASAQPLAEAVPPTVTAPAGTTGATGQATPFGTAGPVAPGGPVGATSPTGTTGPTGQAAPTETTGSAAPPPSIMPAAPGLPSVTPSPVPAPAVVRSVFNPGAASRSQIRATFGSFHVRFLSSEKLGTAWTDALRAAGLTGSSTMGAIHRAVRGIASDAVTKTAVAAPAFRNWVNAALPEIFSTSSQGIVIGGNVANDVQIVGNTIDGTAQGIHVGLSDIEAGKTKLQVRQVSIRGNRIGIRLTPATTGDRHGIFLGGEASALIDDNHLEVTYGPNAGQGITAIKVTGTLGRRLLISRNLMLNFRQGIVVTPKGLVTESAPVFLWKASDNVSSFPNSLPGAMKSVDNVPI